MSADAKIFVEPLSDYNAKVSHGKWFDFSNYTDGETLVEAIRDFLKEVDDEHKGKKRKEYIITGYEGFPSWYYSEHMTKDSFDDIYSFIELSNDYDPAAIEGFVNAGHDLGKLKDAYYGKFKSEEDFATEFVETLGGASNLSNPGIYLFVSDTDRRVMANEEADSYYEGIKDEDGGERLIEEADLDVEEFKSAKKKEKAEMLNDAEQALKKKRYDEWYDGLDDVHDFLVNDQGIYSKEDLSKASFVQVDYDKLSRDLLINDYFSVDDGEGGIYVFNRNY